MTTAREPDPHPDLFALVKGELTNAETTDAAEHLSECPTCREELVDVIAGHALMTRAARTMRSAPPVTTPVDPWVAQDLPPLSAPRRRRPGRLVLAAAAALVVGAGVAGALTLGGDDASQEPAPLAVPEQVVTLDAVEGEASGEVRMVRDGAGTQITINAPDLPGTDARHFYQAWLLNPATNKMLPLGLVSEDSTTFRISDDLLSAYGAVDVSLEVDDGDPQHSVTSVLRGSYEPAV